jgi:hypothetical protein
VQDTRQEIEDIRAKITRVAELFEKKPISQKYTFEVLCDFISDKAKRMLSKYEALQKLHAGDSRTNCVQKKVDQLQQDQRTYKPLSLFAERVLDVVVPRLHELLEHPP